MPLNEPVQFLCVNGFAIKSQLLQAAGSIFGKGNKILLLFLRRTQLHFYQGASERSHQKELLKQLNKCIEQGGQRIQRSVILKSRTRFLGRQKSMAQPPKDKHITYQLQYRKCGKPNCSTCRTGRGHGPYWYAYWYEGTRLRSSYIGKTRVQASVSDAPPAAPQEARHDTSPPEDRSKN